MKIKIMKSKLGLVSLVATLIDVYPHKEASIKKGATFTHRNIATVPSAIPSFL